MKKLIFILLALVTFAGTQSLGTRYLWADKIAITTAAVDSFFVTRWEFVTIYSDTLDLWLKFGSPDTASWASRDWMKLEAGTSFSFEAPMYLKGLSYKTVTGSGFIYIMGGKKVAQY